MTAFCLIAEYRFIGAHEMENQKNQRFAVTKLAVYNNTHSITQTLGDCAGVTWKANKKLSKKVTVVEHSKHFSNSNGFA